MTSQLPVPNSPNPAVRFVPYLLLAIVFGVFATGVTADFVWDDKILILGNPRFAPPTFESIAYYWIHPFCNLYQPLTCSVWAILAKLDYIPTPDEAGSHFNPYLFHLACVLFHSIAVLGVYRLLRLMVGMTFPAAMGAALFALHPIQVEAVAFIGVINNPLYACLAIFAIIDYLQATSATSNSSLRRTFWVRGTILFILAMLAKPTAVVVPAIAMILDRTCNRRSLSTVFRSATPWFLLAIPCVIWTKLNQPGAISTASTPLLFRPLIAMDTIAVQLFHILAPVSLTIDYGRTPGYLLSHHAWLITAFVTLALGIIAWMCRRALPIVSAAIAIFILGLLPNSGLVPFDFQQYSTVADRYAYLSMLGIALLFAWIITKIEFRISIPVAIIMLITCTVLTEYQIHMWQDDETL